jgi:hypothetical protein
VQEWARSFDEAAATEGAGAASLPTEGKENDSYGDEEVPKGEMWKEIASS